MTSTILPPRRPYRRAARAVMLAAMMTWLLQPASSTAEAAAQGEKSAEDIVNGLLGGPSRGIGGVRAEGDNGGGGRIGLPIQFEYNSATISQTSLPQLKKVATALQDERLKDSRIQLEGHTDNVGGAAYNLKLSERRANAVKEYLTQKLDIPASQLVAKGFGQSRPLADVASDTDAGRAQQRRVEFVNLGAATAANAPKGNSRAVSMVEADSAPAAAAKLAVNVVVDYQRGGDQHTLTPGSVLTPEDNFRVTFTPNRDSYVYVYHLDNAGKVDSVFPNRRLSQNLNPVKANSTQKIPPEGQWLGVSKNPGDEQIVVLASESPVADPHALALRLAKGDVSVELTTAMRGPAAAPRGDVLAEPPTDMFSYRLPFKSE